MKFFTILYTEIKQGFRDPKTFFIMIFMPTILTIFLSMVFKDDLNSKIDYSSIKVGIFVTDTSDKYTTKTITNVLEKNNIRFKLITDINRYKFDNEIILKQISKNDIKIYYTKANSIYGEIIMNILKKFFEEEALTKKVSNSTYKNSFALENTNNINLKTLSDDFPVNSLDYYGVSMVILTVMFSSVSGAYKIIKEREFKTLQKLRIMPINMNIVILSKLIGILFISFIQISIVIAISSKLLKVNWGDNLFLIILLLLSLSTLSISFGMFIGNFINDNRSCWILLLSFIMTNGLIGGAFVPLSIIKSNVINSLSIFSPIHYALNCTFNNIYSNGDDVIKITILFFITIALIFIKLSTFLLEGTQ